MISYQRNQSLCALRIRSSIAYSSKEYANILYEQLELGESCYPINPI